MTQTPVINLTAHRLKSVLCEFKVDGNIVAIQSGPIITTYEFQPEPGTKISKIIGLTADIARCMGTSSIRITNMTVNNTIGIEIPNTLREVVSFSNLIESNAWIEHQGNLPIILGKGITGEPVIADLAKMPHLLIAGATGSGKSVGIHSIIMSLLTRFTSYQCRFILIDPKKLEMSQYAMIPHLLTPVITEPNKVITALNWAIAEMERRYHIMQSLNVQNIVQYNELINRTKINDDVLYTKTVSHFDSDGTIQYKDTEVLLYELPYIVIVIDEFANLMLQTGKQVEIAIQQLSQMARAAGIHMVLATQRPSVNVITGTIKANFPTRISFKVQCKIDSRTILGEHGAEQLLGNGDMLYLESGAIARIQGAYIDNQEIKDQVTHSCKGMALPYDIIGDDEE